MLEVCVRVNWLVADGCLFVGFAVVVVVLQFMKVVYKRNEICTCCGAGSKEISSEFWCE